MWEANLTSNVQVSYNSSKERHFHLLPRANSHFLWHLWQMGRRLCAKTAGKRCFLCKERLLRQARERPHAWQTGVRSREDPASLRSQPRWGAASPKPEPLCPSAPRAFIRGAALLPCSPGNCSARRGATLEVEGVNPPRSNNRKGGDW